MSDRFRLPILCAAFGLAPLLLPEYQQVLLIYIALSAMVVLGLVLLTGVAGLTSFGQAAYVGIASYTTAFLTTAYSFSPWATLPFALLVTCIIAYVVGRVTARLSGHFLALATLAIGAAAYHLFSNLSFTGGHTGISGIPPLGIGFGPIRETTAVYLLAWTVLLVLVLLLRNLLDSRHGRAIRALNGGSQMAEAMGVDTSRCKIAVFIIACLMAALSGWIYAHFQRFINPSPFSVLHGIEYLFMAVVGGATGAWGAIVGAAVFTFAHEWLQNLLPAMLRSQGDFEIVFFGLVMILILQYSPAGLWPKLSRQRPWVPRAIPNVKSALVPRSKPAHAERILEIAGIRKAYAGLVANDDIDLHVNAGEVLALVGPNGAGKSTLFNLIAGVIPPSSGRITFRGIAITGKSSREISQLGLSKTFQHVQLLPTMSTLENVAIGAHARGKRGIVAACVRLDRTEESILLGEATRALIRVGLADEALLPAGSLPLGKQRIVEIARALCSDPVVLLLDEPAAGLRHREKQELARLIQTLKAEGMSIVLVEHDMNFVMQLADRIAVMNFGRKIAEGLPGEIRDNPAVIEAYLGGTI